MSAKAQVFAAAPSLLARARSIQVTKSTAIIAVVAVVGLVLLVGYLVSDSSPSASQVVTEQQAAADKLSRWAAARDGARKQAPTGQRLPAGAAQRPAGR